MSNTMCKHCEPSGYDRETGMPCCIEPTVPAELEGKVPGAWVPLYEDSDRDRERKIARGGIDPWVVTA